MNPSIGHHWLVEMYGIEAHLLEQADIVRKILNGAVSAANASKVSENFHQFEPVGVSGVIVIEESHFTIHTWPEHGYAAVDCFTCGVGIDNEKAVEYLKKAFDSHMVEVRYFRRGDLGKADAGKEKTAKGQA